MVPHTLPTADCPLSYLLFVSAVNGRVLIGDNLRKSAVKYLLFFRSPVVSGAAFAAYCHLPTVFLSRLADSYWRYASFSVCLMLQS